MPQDISKTFFAIQYDENLRQFALVADGEHVLTPGGHPVTHQDRRFLERMRAELDGDTTLDPASLGRYSIYCTYRDNFSDGKNQFDEEEIRQLIFGDRLLHLAPGPEVVDQLSNLTPLSRMLETNGWVHPLLPIYRSHEEIEGWVIDQGQVFSSQINDLVKGLYFEITTLHPAQITIIVNVAVVYDSVLLGYLLATRQCTELEFAMAILATDGALPKVFGDATQEEYRSNLAKLLFDAHSLVDFARYYTNPSLATRQLLQNKLPNFAFLPESAQWALSERLEKIENHVDGDYSGYVVLLAKALESTLMDKVFDQFRFRSGIQITQEQDVKLLIRNEYSEIERFATYVLKEPHFLELGAMMVTLEKYGGKTAKRNPMLGSFFDYVKTAHNQKLLSGEFIALGKEVARLRNRAAHKEIMNWEQAVEVRETVLQLLGWI